MISIIALLTFLLGPSLVLAQEEHVIVFRGYLESHPNSPPGTVAGPSGSQSNQIKAQSQAEYAASVNYNGWVASEQRQLAQQYQANTQALQTEIRNRVESASNNIRNNPVQIPNASIHPPPPIKVPEWVATKSPAEQNVISRTAQSYQNYFANNHSFMTENDVYRYQAGIFFLKQSDREFQFKNDAAIGYYSISKIILSSFKGFSEGIEERLDDIKRLLPSMYEASKQFVYIATHDPARLITATQNLIYAMPKFKDAFIAVLLDTKDVILDGSAEERGKLAGKLVFDVLLGAGAGKTLGLIGKYSDDASKLVSTARSSLMNDAHFIKTQAKLVQPLIHRVDSLNPSLKQALQAELASNPEKGIRLVSLNRNLSESAFSELRNSADAITEKALRSGSPHAEEFLRRSSVASRDPETALGTLRSADDVDRIIQKTSHFDKTLDGVKLKEQTLTYHRVALEKGPHYTTTEETLFRPHPGTPRTIQRYGMGGEAGVGYVSAATGEKVDAWQTALGELEKHVGPKIDQPLILDSQTRPFKRVLDLTDETVLRDLGISVGDITVPMNYETPQIIGFLASEKKIDAILAPSAAVAGGRVIHIPTR